MTPESLFAWLVNADLPLVGLALAIFLLTFLLEEAAAALAVLLVLAGEMSMMFALVVVFAGVWASDLALYGLGYSARRVPWTRRWLDEGKVIAAGHWMGQRMTHAVVLSRVLPWSLPPVFIACGLFGLPFSKFVWVVTWTGAVWTAVVFGSLFGGGQLLMALDWTAASAGMALLVVIVAYMLYRRFTLQKATEAFPSHLDFKSTQSMTVPAWVTASSAGQTALEGERISRRPAENDLHAEDRADTPQACWFERLPAAIFYLPVVLMWLVLALRYRSLTLPTAANPRFEAGGLVGESKAQVMSQVGSSVRAWFAPSTSFTTADRADDLHSAMDTMRRHGLSFPIVAKPDRGHHGQGVCPITTDIELGQYLAGYPSGETLELQQLVPFAHEAGVFYVRLPGQAQGRLFSVNLSDPPHVWGDGISTLRGLINDCPNVSRCKELHFEAQAHRLAWVPAVSECVELAFARSHRLGATLHDGRHLINPVLSARFDEIAQGIAGFYFGRFDLRFRSLEEFSRGEAFQIVEINGVGAEANHIWDPSATLAEAYRTLWKQYKLAFAIGARNRARGHAPMPLWALLALMYRQRRVLQRLEAQEAQRLGTLH